MMLRHSSGPGEIAGYNWPTGTIFHMNFAAINKHKDHWDNPEKFDPERFMKKDEHRHKYAFNFFGGGLRICPGILILVFSILFIFYFLIHLFFLIFFFYI